MSHCATRKVADALLPGFDLPSDPKAIPTDKEEAKGTIITLFFINDEVVRIIFQNQIVQNRVLFKLANSFYKSGFVKNQKIIDANDPEQYAI